MELQFIGETYLKVAPVPADDLDPKDKVLKAPGQSETVKAVRFADTGPIPAIEVKHIKVETDSTVWYVYGPHVYLEKGTDKELMFVGAPITDEMRVVFNVKHLPDLDELRLPPRPFEQARAND